MTKCVIFVSSYYMLEPMNLMYGKIKRMYDIKNDRKNGREKYIRKSEKMNDKLN